VLSTAHAVKTPSNFFRILCTKIYENWLLLYSSLFNTSGSNKNEQKHVEKYKRKEKEN